MRILPLDKKLQKIVIFPTHHSFVYDVGMQRKSVQKCTCPRYRCELKLSWCAMKIKDRRDETKGGKMGKGKRRKRGKKDSKPRIIHEIIGARYSRQRGYSPGVIKRNGKKSRPKSRPRNTTPITRRITELVNDRFNVCDTIRGRGIVIFFPPPFFLERRTDGRAGIN